MSHARILDGVIKQVEGTTPGLASGIAYTITVNEPGGGTQDYRGQVPVMRLWPEPLKVDAAKLKGTAVLGMLIDNRVLWFFPEPPLVAPCGGTPTPPPNPEPPPGGVFLPPSQGGGQAQGGGASGVPGGSGEQ